MGLIVGFLQFALKCVDLFAWPIFALAYPLFASIRAIETNSNSHMRKLVTYWILFSLISLFELTFAKFIEWFPVWPYIKIIAICWLVIPRFTRAYHAYKHLVQIRSYANLQVVINWLNKHDKEYLLKTEETFLSVAEKYIKDNGSEALEELIANKSKGAEPNLDAKEKMAVTITEKKEMAKTTENFTEFRFLINVIKYDRILQMLVSVFPHKGAKPNLDAKDKLGVTSPERKEMATTIESKGAGAKPGSEEIKAVANTENEEKATKIKSEGAKPNFDAEEIKVANREKKEMVAIESKGAKPDAEEIKTIASTEKKEMATKVKLEGEKPSLDVEDVKVANSEKNEKAAVELKHANANLAETETRTAEAVKVKEMNMPATAAGGENCSAFSDKVQRQWTCAVCEVTTTSETTLNSHFQGKKHIAVCEELKARKLTRKNKNYVSSTINKSEQANQNPNKCVSGDGLNKSKSKQQQKNVQVNNGNIKWKNGKLCCCICNVSCGGEIDMTSHLKGKKHLSMVQA